MGGGWHCASTAAPSHNATSPPPLSVPPAQRSTRLRALRQQLSAESREHWEAQLGSSLRAVVPGRNSLAFEQALIRCQDGELRGRRESVLLCARCPPLRALPSANSLCRFLLPPSTTSTDPLVCPHELGFMRLRAGGPETPVAVEFNHRHAAAPPAQLGGGGVRPMRVGIPAALAESQGIIEGAIVVVCVAGVSIAGAATLLPASPYVTLPLEAIEALLAAGLGELDATAGECMQQETVAERGAAELASLSLLSATAGFRMWD